MWLADGRVGMGEKETSMKKTTAQFMIIFVCVLFSGSLFAQGQSEEEAQPQSFVEELVMQLRERDWSEEDLRVITEQAGELSWEEADQADAELIAYALTYERRRGDAIDETAGLNRAQLALDLARQTMEMEQFGYSRQNIARAAVEGVQNALEQVENGKNQGRDMNLGEIMQNTVRDRVLPPPVSGRGTAAERAKEIRLKHGVIPQGSFGSGKFIK